MDRAGTERLIVEAYGAEPEHPWLQYPNYTVFRHSGNKKWFAVIMELPRDRLEPGRDGCFDVMNVKCDPRLIGSFRAMPGVYPAYHMSKANWLSVALDGSAEDETVRTLLEMSYGLTAPRPKGRREKGTK